MASEWNLMWRAFGALFYEGSNIDRLVDADLEAERKVNPQFAKTTEQQRQFRVEYTKTVKERVALLRGNLRKSLLFLLIAMVCGFLVKSLASEPMPSAAGVLSVFCLAWSTLARLGYGGKSIGGNTAIERLDRQIFKILFVVGTFFGIVALTP
jgi:hypothetical protein